MRRLLVPLAVVAAGASVLAACGTSSSPTRSSGTKGPTPVQLSGIVNNKGTKDVTGSGATLEVDARDFSFGPTFVKAAPGQTISVDVKNLGSNEHTFTIDALGIDETLDPGQTASVTVTVPQSGALGWYCRFHRSQGMQGAFFSAAGQAVVPGTGATPGATAPSTSIPPTTARSSSGGGGGGYNY